MQLDTYADSMRTARSTAEAHPADHSDSEAVADLDHKPLENRGRVEILIGSAGKSIRRCVTYDHFYDFV